MPLTPTPPAFTSDGSRTDALLHGVYATATLNGITLLHLFDWEVRLSNRLLDASGHGDEWEQWVPLRQGWTARARGYMTRSSGAAFTYVGSAAKLSASPAELIFTGYSDMGNTVIFQGGCFWEDITMQSPNAMVTQEISLRGSMAPTTGPAA